VVVPVSGSSSPRRRPPAQPEQPGVLSNVGEALGSIPGDIFGLFPEVARGLVNIGKAGISDVADVVTLGHSTLFENESAIGGSQLLGEVALPMLGSLRETVEQASVALNPTALGIVLATRAATGSGEGVASTLNQLDDLYELFGYAAGAERVREQTARRYGEGSSLVLPLVEDIGNLALAAGGAGAVARLGGRAVGSARLTSVGETARAVSRVGRERATTSMAARGETFSPAGAALGEMARPFRTTFQGAYEGSAAQAAVRTRLDNVRTRLAESTMPDPETGGPRDVRMPRLRTALMQALDPDARAAGQMINRNKNKAEHVQAEARRVFSDADSAAAEARMESFLSLPRLLEDSGQADGFTSKMQELLDADVDGIYRGALPELPTSRRAASRVSDEQLLLILDTMDEVGARPRDRTRVDRELGTGGEDGPSVRDTQRALLRAALYEKVSKAEPGSITNAIRSVLEFDDASHLFAAARSALAEYYTPQEMRQLLSVSLEEGGPPVGDLVRLLEQTLPENLTPGQLNALTRVVESYREFSGVNERVRLALGNVSEQVGSRLDTELNILAGDQPTRFEGTQASAAANRRINHRVEKAVEAVERLRKIDEIIEQQGGFSKLEDTSTLRRQRTAMYKEMQGITKDLARMARESGQLDPVVFNQILDLFDEAILRGVRLDERLDIDKPKYVTQAENNLAVALDQLREARRKVDEEAAAARQETVTTEVAPEFADMPESMAASAPKADPAAPKVVDDQSWDSISPFHKGPLTLRGWRVENPRNSRLTSEAAEALGRDSLLGDGIYFGPLEAVEKYGDAVPVEVTFENPRVVYGPNETLDVEDFYDLDMVLGDVGPGKHDGIILPNLTAFGVDERQAVFYGAADRVRRLDADVADTAPPAAPAPRAAGENFGKTPDGAIDGDALVGAVGSTVRLVTPTGEALYEISRADDGSVWLTNQSTPGNESYLIAEAGPNAELLGIGEPDLAAADVSFQPVQTREGRTATRERTRAARRGDVSAASRRDLARAQADVRRKADRLREVSGRWMDSGRTRARQASAQRALRQREVADRAIARALEDLSDARQDFLASQEAVPRAARTLTTYGERVAPQVAAALRAMEGDAATKTALGELADKIEQLPQQFDEMADAIGVDKVTYVPDVAPGRRARTDSSPTLVAATDPSYSRRQGVTDTPRLEEPFELARRTTQATLSSKMQRDMVTEFTSMYAKTIEELRAEFDLPEDAPLDSIMTRAEEMGYVQYDPSDIFRTFRDSSRYATPDLLFVQKTVASVASEMSSRSRGVIDEFFETWWDPTLSAWRGSVLALAPRWQVNNHIGNFVMSTFAGHVSVADYFNFMATAIDLSARTEQGLLDGQLRIINPGSNPVQRARVLNRARTGRLTESDVARTIDLNDADIGSLQELFNSSMLRSERSEGLRTPIGDAVARRAKDGEDGIITTASRGAEATRDLARMPIEASYRINGTVDNMNRAIVAVANAFTDDLGRIDFDAPVNIDEGVRAANNALGDYNAMSEFERRTLRRIFPFYAWTRHITGVLYRQLTNVNEIDRTILFTQIGQVLGEPDAEEELLPEWASNRVFTGYNEYGIPQFINPRGGDPFTEAFVGLEALTDIGDLGRFLARSAGPVGGGLYEYSTGTDVFSGTPLTGVPDEEGRVRPSLGQMATEALPQVQLVRDFYRQAKGESTVRLDDDTPFTGTRPGTYTTPNDRLRQFLGLFPSTPLDTRAIRQREIENERARLTRVANAERARVPLSEAIGSIFG